MQITPRSCRCLQQTDGHTHRCTIGHCASRSSRSKIIVRVHIEAMLRDTISAVILSTLDFETQVKPERVRECDDGAFKIIDDAKSLRLSDSADPARGDSPSHRAMRESVSSRRCCVRLETGLFQRTRPWRDRSGSGAAPMEVARAPQTHSPVIFTDRALNALWASCHLSHSLRIHSWPLLSPFLSLLSHRTSAKESALCFR